jgi:thiamine kinase-like enzyme
VTRVLPVDTATVTVDQVIDRVPEWRGRSITVEPLAGGLTNSNYRVDVDGEAFVVRIPGTATELLAVDRRNEYHNTRVAADAGVGPRVVHYLPDLQVMVVEFIRGRTMTIADLQASGMPGRIVRSLRLLHAAPRFHSDVSFFRLIDFFLDIVARRGIRIPEGYHSRLAVLRRIEAALATRPLPTVPCHNDLLPENYIDDGRLLRFVDFEYSGNNDPAFDLGNTCVELGYDEGRITELCATYFGEATRNRVARVKLNMIVSDAGWTLWAAIQAAISRIEFDFWRYGIDRWTRAEARMDASDFPAWLDAVAHPG